MTTFDETFFEFKGPGECTFAESTKDTLFGSAQKPDTPSDSLLNDFVVLVRNVFNKVDSKMQFAKTIKIKFKGSDIEVGRKFDGLEPEMYCLVCWDGL